MSPSHATLEPLRGSRPPLAGRRSLGPADPGARVELTVVLRRRRRGVLGADGAAVRAVERFARATGLEVTDADGRRRCVCLAGSAEACAAAFGVRLERFAISGATSRAALGFESEDPPRTPDVTHRSHRGPVRLPTALRPSILAVLGFDDRPQARTQFRPFPSAPGIAARAAAVSYTPPQVAALYDFPVGADGRGTTIAFLELGGGHRTDDLDAYFRGLGLSRPTVVSQGVDGAADTPTGDPNGPDGEVMLDLEVCGAIAPAARLAAWFAPNTDRGFLDGVTAAVHASPTPAALSISWGAPEAEWSGQARSALDAAFADAALLDVTVCCAAGDHGSSDGLTDGRAHVDYPASSPQVLGCGGTRLEAAGQTISDEAVWNDGPGGGATGGGVSDVYALPPWQRGADVPASANPGARIGRGVPDVSGDADPQTGYRVRVDGRDAVYGGTSAVAPLWAGLMARLVQVGAAGAGIGASAGSGAGGSGPSSESGSGASSGPGLGALAPRLYGLASDLRDVTSGSNGAYRAGPGWDACSGLGSPDGARLAVALRGPARQAGRKVADRPTRR